MRYRLLKIRRFFGVRAESFAQHGCDFVLVKYYYYQLQPNQARYQYYSIEPVPLVGLV